MGDAIDYNQRSRTNIGELIMETLEVEGCYRVRRKMYLPLTAVEPLRISFPHPSAINPSFADRQKGACL